MSATNLKTIRFEKAGPIATLTMNRPDRLNAIAGPMMREMSDTLAAIAEDPQVRILILTGAGRGFCAGADLNGIVEGDTGLDTAESRPPTFDFRIPVLLHNMPAVTMAAVNGACAGAGFGWACACDLRIAAASARFNTAFLDVGVAGDMGGPWTLPRIIGAARAREIYFMPDKFDADHALKIGLVSRVFSDETFRDEVKAIASRLSDAAPIALRTMKSNFIEAERIDFESYIALETARHIPMFTTEDTREAFAAKVEKRKPKFKGR